MVKKLVLAFFKARKSRLPSVEACHLTQPKGSLTFHLDAASGQSWVGSTVYRSYLT